MKKSEQQVKWDVANAIEGFLGTLVDRYVELHKANRTKESCLQYVKSYAAKEKPILIKTFNEIEIQSFKTIENTWLKFIETIEDFETLLTKQRKQLINKKIKTTCIASYH